MIPLDFNPGTVNATAYAAKRPNGKLLLALINKDPSAPLEVRVLKHGSAMLHELKAASLSSRDADFDNFNENKQPSKCVNGVCIGHGAGGPGTSTADDWLHLTVPPAYAVIADLDHEIKEPY
jgi:hypothetical protein